MCLVLDDTFFQNCRSPGQSVHPFVRPMSRVLAYMQVVPSVCVQPILVRSRVSVPSLPCSREVFQCPQTFQPNPPFQLKNECAVHWTRDNACSFASWLLGAFLLRTLWPAPSERVPVCVTLHGTGDDGMLCSICVLVCFFVYQFLIDTHPPWVTTTTTPRTTRRHEPASNFN